MSRKNVNEIIKKFDNCVGDVYQLAVMSETTRGTASEHYSFEHVIIKKEMLLFSHEYCLRKRRRIYYVCIMDMSVPEKRELLQCHGPRKVSRLGQKSLYTKLGKRYPKFPCCLVLDNAPHHIGKLRNPFVMTSRSLLITSAEEYTAYF